MRLAFSKMHGCGNDFLVCEALSRPLRLDTEQIRRLADRHFGVGFDQLLLIEPPLDPSSDFALAIFNSDGSPAEHCGNGARCVARFVLDRRFTHKQVLTWDVISRQGAGRRFVTRQLDDDRFDVEMGVPDFSAGKVPEPIKALARQISELVWTTEALEFTPVNLGNAHVVVMVEDLHEAGVNLTAKLVESANVGFCQTVDHGRLKLRVFERGVGETLACGSGACAAAAVAQRLGKVGTKVLLDVPGGELEVEWRGVGTMIHLRGPAQLSFRGSLSL